MRITLIVYGSLDGTSGGYAYDRYLVAALRLRGHEVSILGQPSCASYHDEVRLGRDSRWADAVGETQPDCVVIDELNHAAWPRPMIARLRRSIPECTVVALVHHLRADEKLFRWRARWRERSFLRAVDAWLCNSRTTARRVRRTAGTVRSTGVAYPGADGASGVSNLRGISPGADGASGVSNSRGISPGADGASGVSNSRGISPGADGASGVKGRAGVSGSGAAREFRILALGTVTPRKNIHRLLMAIARVRRRRRGDTAQRRLSVTIAGDPTVDPAYVQRVHHLAERLGLADVVSFRGHLPIAEVSALLAETDLFALPSLYEGFGIVYLEAMARGVPALGGRRGAAGEVIGRGGVVVSPVSVASIASAIGRFVDDPGYLARTGAEALGRARRYPVWDVSMAEGARFLEHVTQKRQSVRASEPESDI